MSRSGNGRRRTAQRNLLYQESSLWGVGAAACIVACLLVVALAVFFS